MKTAEKTGTLIDAKNRQIPISSWIPPRTDCQLVVVHGFCEHSHCYAGVARELSDRGVAVHIMDLPGHGNAGGIRGHIDHFEEYLDNVSLLINANPFFLKTKPAFLLGHSLGGAVSLLYCMRRDNIFRGLTVTSPLIGFSPVGSFLTSVLARFLAKNHRADPFPKPNGPQALSRVPEKWELYNSDPLRGRLISPGLYLQMQTMIKLLNADAASLRIPLLMFVSDRDSVVSPGAAQRFFLKTGGMDKSLVAFSNAMHELLQEPECDQILNILYQWMIERI